MEELTIVGQSESGQLKDPNKPKDTRPAAERARELQEMARKKRELKEKEMEQEREKDRVRVGKELAAARRAAEESQRKNIAQEAARQRKEYEVEKRRMMEQLAKDKAERFGKEYVGPEVAKAQ